jgi:hypothetical protein
MKNAECKMQNEEWKDGRWSPLPIFAFCTLHFSFCTGSPAESGELRTITPSPLRPLLYYVRNATAAAAVPSRIAVAARRRRQR